MEKDKVKESAGPTIFMEVIVLGEQDSKAVAMRHCIEASRLFSSPPSLLISLTLSLSGKYEWVGEWCNYDPVVERFITHCGS